MGKKTIIRTAIVTPLALVVGSASGLAHHVNGVSSAINSTTTAHHVSGIQSAVTELAAAHHPMGGTTPSTFIEGLLSGIGHPVIGLDHFAFVIGVGLFALLLGRRFTLPLVFVGATMAGVAVHLASINLPATETIIALSVLLIGALALSGSKLPTMALATLFATAGLFHGFAYGEAIFGAEVTPLLAYFLGFAIMQYGVAVGVGYAVQGAVQRLASLSEPLITNVRIAGGIVTGVGLAFTAENLMPF